MRVMIDFDLCDGYGECVKVAPELFETGPDDLTQVLLEEPPEQLWSKAELAARHCPKLAITLVG